MSLPNPADAQPATKPCVMCAEPIRAVARICPHCGSGQSLWTRPIRLDGLWAPSPTATPPVSADTQGQTKACAWCAEPIRLAARVCPHCRRMQPRWARRIWVELVVFCALFAGGGAWLLLTLRSSLGPGRSFEPHRHQLVVVSSERHWSSATNGNFISVIGQLRNDSPHAWKQIELEVQYFDAQGRLIDTRSDTLWATVPPGATHSFRVRGPADKPESAYASHHVRVNWAKDARTLP